MVATNRIRKGGHMRERKLLATTVVMIVLALLLVALPSLGACTKEKIVEVPVEKVVEKEVVKEVPVEKVVEKEVVKEVPVEKGVLFIGSLANLTGPGSGTTAPLHKGYVDYFTWINNEGGIGGHQVDILWTDTKYKTDVHLSTFERWLDRNLLGVMPSSTGASIALRGPSVKSKIPVCLVRSPAQFIFPQAEGGGVVPVEENYGYGLLPLDSELCISMIDWWLKNKHTEDRPLRLALMYMDNPYGTAALAGGAMEWLEANPKVEIVADIPIPFGVTDLTAEVIKIKDSEADVIQIMMIYGPEPALLFRTLADLNITDVPVLHQSDHYGTIIRGQPAELPVECYFACPYTQRGEKDNPGVKRTDEIYMKLHNSETSTDVEEWQHGWLTAQFLSEGIKKAMLEVGYEKIDGEAVKKALDDIEVDTWGMTGPAGFSPDNHCYTRTARILYGTVGNQDIKPLSDWFEVISLPPPWMK